MLVMCVITAVVARVVLTGDREDASYTIMMDSINDFDGKAMETFRGRGGFGHNNAQATE